MRQYNLTLEDSNILFNSHFYSPKLKYYSNLDFIPYNDLSNWVYTIKNSTKQNQVKLWLDKVSVYLNLLHLLKLSHQIVYSSNIYELMEKSSLITTNFINKNMAELLLINYLKESTICNYETNFILVYCKSVLGLLDSTIYKFFSKINSLSYLDKEYFYKMFYYFSLDETQLFTNLSNYRFIEKCINIWFNICSGFNCSEINYCLTKHLSLKCNNNLIQYILNPDLLKSKTLVISKENKLKCEDIIGLSVNSDYYMGKQKYLLLIKENHPDRHPQEFEYYSQKTVEINLAWNEWRLYNNESKNS